MGWVSLIVVLTVSGCGVIWPYAYDAHDVEDRLSVAMSKEQVVQALGKPSRAMLHDDKTTVWEYWRYPKGEWLGYLIHCPFHPYCYIPAEPRNPYYVALRDDHVCLWGTPDLVRTLIAQVCTADAPGGRRWNKSEHLRRAMSLSCLSSCRHELPHLFSGSQSCRWGRQIEGRLHGWT